MMLTNTTNCSNCNKPVQDHFCGNCGHPVQLKRVDGRYILHEIQHVLHVEKGLLYTIKELLIRPGQTIRTFIADNRSRLVKPVLFIIVTSLIFTIIDNCFEVEATHTQLEDLKIYVTGFIFYWIHHHYGYANLLMGIAIALWMRVFFRRHDYNFFELLILFCFVMGIGMLINAVFSLIQGLTKLDLAYISAITGIAYCMWAIAQFFNKTSVTGYLKALASYVLGMLSFYIAAIAIGLTIDLWILR